jgi:DNA polymerase III epsilon subunit family exonuclease
LADYIITELDRFILFPWYIIANMQLCFIDTETTGLYTAAGDRICEIGLIIVDSELEIVERFESLINSQRPISPEAYRVNRITEAELKNAPLFADLSFKLSDLVRDRIIVGHNVEFDNDFLKNEFDLSGADYEPGALLDTRTIAKALISSSSYGLSVLMRYFGIKISNRHRALGDCQAAYELFLRLFKLYREKTGRDLTDFIEEYSIKPSEEKHVLPAWLQSALDGNQPLRIEYCDRENLRTVRIIKPLRVFCSHGRHYLEAFCMSKSAKRTFLVDRIKKVDY